MPSSHVDSSNFACSPEPSMPLNRKRSSDRMELVARVQVAHLSRVTNTLQASARLFLYSMHFFLYSIEFVSYKRN
jgi:hypothetical protein